MGVSGKAPVTLALEKFEVVRRKPHLRHPFLFMATTTLIFFIKNLSTKARSIVKNTVIDDRIS